MAKGDTRTVVVPSGKTTANGLGPQGNKVVRNAPPGGTLKGGVVEGIKKT